MICPICCNCWLDDNDSNYECPECGKLTFETAVTSGVEINIEIPELAINTPVVFKNEQHPWYNSTVLIIGKKHKFYRIRKDQKTLWVPKHWVKND